MPVAARAPVSVRGLLACLAVAACLPAACSTTGVPGAGPAAVSTTPPSPTTNEATVAHAAQAQAAAPSSAARQPDDALPDFLADLAGLVGRDNADRGEALLRLFRERGLTPEIQEFRPAAPPARPGEPSQDRHDVAAGQDLRAPATPERPSEPSPGQDLRAPAETLDRQPAAIGRNLIVTVGEGSRDIVVGAHYDAVRLRDGAIVGGAVDNGAASVVLTRVAGTLTGRELAHRVRVVLFDLEESGLLGSRAYLENEDPGRIAAMVNADVVAGSGALMYGPTSHDGNETVYRSLRVACAATGLPCIGFPRYPPSDDRNFQAAGVPNVSLAMNAPVAAHQMWLVLNAGAEAGLREGFVPEVFRVIHTAEDTIERVDETSMNQLHDLLVALVLELDAAL